MTIEYITKEQAIEAATKAAWVETFPEGEEEATEPRTLLHNLIESGPIMLGADWDLSAVIDLINSSSACAWNDEGLAGHQLGVIDAGATKCYWFEAPKS